MGRISVLLRGRRGNLDTWGGEAATKNRVVCSTTSPRGNGVRFGWDRSGGGVKMKVVGSGTTERRATTDNRGTARSRRDRRVFSRKLGRHTACRN